MEAVVRTQIELFRQNSNYLTIRTRARKRFFYLGTPHMVVALAEKRLKTPFEDQHRRPAAQDERKRKNGALSKDSSHQACQALTLFQLEKVNCARCVPRQAFPRSPWPIGEAK